jgi:glycosyltransferase involved in cell wall biosynthesis
MNGDRESLNRPNLLFLTPTLPHTTGTGSAIRAGIALESLAKRFNVYVLHAELWGWHRKSFSTDFVRRHAARYVYYVPENGELPMPQIMSEHFSAIRFQAVHTFRMVMARAGVSFLVQAGEQRPLAVIDLDDDEYDRSERFAKLREQAGDNARARSEELERPQLRMLERLLAPRFQVICLASANDCARLRERHPGAHVIHLPNAVFLPQSIPARSTENPPTLLFVGTLDYLPNEDGIHYFCTQILPLIRRTLTRTVRVLVVGAHPKPRVLELTREPEVEVLANVPDLAPYYAAADAIIVPLRAGSGTRIKILEAFSFGKPVVSTSVGAEGLDLIHGKELLIADEPEAFARACIELLNLPVLCSTLSESASQWLTAHHSIHKVEAVLRSIYEPVLQSASLSNVAG